MYRLRLNSVGTKTRKELLSDKEYLVVHGTLIVPGVLPGSAGPLLYPDKDVIKSINAWNGMPIVLGHPYENGKPISARQSRIINESGIGTVFNARKGKNNKLQAELWFDVAALARINPSLLQQIRNGEQIEVSTGLNAKKHPAPKQAVHNGKKYTGIARDYRPDHLAVLIDSKGACSVRDGCGIHVNKRKRQSSKGDSGMKLNPKQRKRYIDYLVSNCDCWSGEEDAALLAKMPSSKLVSLRKGVINRKKSEAVVNSLRDELGIPEDTELTAASIRAVIANTTIDDEDEEEEDDDDTALKPKSKKKAPVVNKKAAKGSNEDDETPVKKLTPKEWFEQAPEEVQEVFNRARTVNNKAKTEVIEKLVANISDKAKRKAKIEKFSKMKLDQLEDLLDLLPKGQQVNNSRKSKGDYDDFLEGDGDYRGAAAPLNNRRDTASVQDDDDFDDDDDRVDNEDDQRNILPISVVNFEDDNFLDDEDDVPVHKGKKRSRQTA